MEAICLPDDQLDLVVGCLDPCVAHTEPYGVQYMALVAFSVAGLVNTDVDKVIRAP